MLPKIQPDIFQDLITRHFGSNQNHNPVDVKVAEMVGSPVGIVLMLQKQRIMHQKQHG